MTRKPKIGDEVVVRGTLKDVHATERYVSYYVDFQGQWVEVSPSMVTVLDEAGDAAHGEA